LYGMGHNHDGCSCFAHAEFGSLISPVDVKFYQNKLTNVQSKLIALKVALVEKRDEGLTKILDCLVQTERNFILKKDEATVELERGRLEPKGAKGLVDSFSALIDKIRCKS